MHFMGVQLQFPSSVQRCKNPIFALKGNFSYPKLTILFDSLLFAIF